MSSGRAAAARYGAATVAGSIVTLAVLFAMQALIATARTELDRAGRRHFVDFVRVKPMEAVQTKDRRPPKPTRPEARPADVPETRLDPVGSAGATLDLGTVEVQADVAIGGLGLESGDGDYLPIVKIAPVYPWTAQTEGIQGYCIVEYTVTPAGTVKDVVVVEADPPVVFDKASIEAAMKFKYRPRVVDGSAIEVRGVRNLFRYTLDS